MIGDDSFKKTTSFTISTLPSLETIDIGNNCFKSITNQVSFRNFPELTSLRIGNSSFYDEDSPDIINQLFQIYNNSKLLSIEIGEYSFSKFGSSFTVSSLPSLESLTIGSIENESNNFMNVPSIYISSINNI